MLNRIRWKIYSWVTRTWPASEDSAESWAEDFAAGPMGLTPLERLCASAYGHGEGGYRQLSSICGCSPQGADCAS
jgi:hypothetical protein